MQKSLSLQLDIRDKLSENSVAEFSLRYRILTGSGARPSGSTVDTEGSSPGTKYASVCHTFNVEV
jgi:hypothetical protein